MPQSNRLLFASLRPFDCSASRTWRASSTCPSCFQSFLSRASRSSRNGGTTRCFAPSGSSVTRTLPTCFRSSAKYSRRISRRIRFTPASSSGFRFRVSTKSAESTSWSPSKVSASSPATSSPPPRPRTLANRSVLASFRSPQNRLQRGSRFGPVSSAPIWSPSG